MRIKEMKSYIPKIIWFSTMGIGIFLTVKLKVDDPFALIFLFFLMACCFSLLSIGIITNLTMPQEERQRIANMQKRKAKGEVYYNQFKGGIADSHLEAFNEVTSLAKRYNPNELPARLIDGIINYVPYACFCVLKEQEQEPSYEQISFIEKFVQSINCIKFKFSARDFFESIKKDNQVSSLFFSTIWMSQEGIGNFWPLFFAYTTYYNCTDASLAILVKVFFDTTTNFAKLADLPDSITDRINSRFQSSLKYHYQEMMNMVNTETLQ